MSSENILRLAERIAIGIEIGESHYREFKSACLHDAGGVLRPRKLKDVCQDVGEALVAFANADGGELFLGVEDDGTITGVPHKDELVDAIKRAYTEYVHRDTPLSPPVVGDLTIEGHRVLYFSVVQSTQLIHQLSNGKCLRRHDRENRPVPFDEIRKSRGETISREYDRAFVDGVTAGDLDIDLVTHVAEQITPGFSPEKLLQYLGLAEYSVVGLRYRRAALLLFAKDITRWHPRCEVRIVRIAGTELGTGESYNVVVDEPITDTIPKLVDEAWDALRPYLARTRFQATGLFRESLIYPEQACREALVNAIAHRDYSREGSPIEIDVYDDRMEFRSPGGLLSGISVDDLKTLSRVHETRNVSIARTLRELGYVREMGEGLLRMFSAMRDNDMVDPELTSNAEQFSVTLRSQSIFNRQDIEWLEGYKEFDLDKNEQRVVLLGRDGHLLSTNEIIQVTGIVDTDDFRALHEQLLLKGIIYSARRRTGSTAGRRREIGRFLVRPSREVDQFLGELIQVLKAVGPASMLSRDATATVRANLSPSSPYKDQLDRSLQTLGFVDSQRRFLPKALNYVPELEDPSFGLWARLVGNIKSAKQGRYGFIEDDDGTDYYFHVTFFSDDIIWANIRPGMRVSFIPGPSLVPGRADVARSIRFA